VKAFAEIWMVLLCLLLWAVVLPVAGLLEIGVLAMDRGHAPHGLVAHPAR
jgi:hypothetical protein